MGYAEEAKINLARAKGQLNDMPNVVLQVAHVQATLAVLEAIEALSSQVDYLLEANKTE